MMVDVASSLEKDSLALHFHVENMTTGSAAVAPGNGPEIGTERK
ncbi:hypothetical protein LPJGGPFB_01822 [Ensifer adhaerens]|jgi:hypothetical protein|uniref:Uncharacterized protein n=1 Tax=Ensifer adhaerens TaxID=106592 RepID=A0ACC5T151_ENSAD|nr:hypothetical protein [Ensifer adhaerens]NRP18589.1 hypothetical protein [Ensifer adhaerens]RDL52186.1 hypothetical protein BLJAPNOD_03343 [Ensifer sp. M14]